MRRRCKKFGHVQLVMLSLVVLTLAFQLSQGNAAERCVSGVTLSLTHHVAFTAQNIGGRTTDTPFPDERRMLATVASSLWNSL